MCCDGVGGQKVLDALLSHPEEGTWFKQGGDVLSWNAGCTNSVT